MMWEVAVLILSIGIVLFLGFTIPTVWQVRRTARRVEVAADSLNHHLPTILANVEEISNSLTTIMASGKRQIGMLEEATEEIRGLVDDIVQFEREMKHRVEDPLVETVSTISALARAARTFIQVLRGTDRR